MTEPTEAELKWINRFRRVLNDCPPTLWLFADGRLSALKRGPDGERVITENGGMDPGSVIASFNYPECDGGDW